MNQEHANRIESMLSSDALVVDVGGGMAAFPRADWIIDAVPFDERGQLLKGRDTTDENRFNRDTWVQVDLCSRQSWPFEDNQFDFAVCSHVLEDVRDPIWVSSEISRIAKAGYIEVPSRAVEQSKGVEHPRFAGYYHHRWLVTDRDGVLEFRQKPHLLHVTQGAIVSKVGFWRDINPQHQITAHYWDGELRCDEVLEFDEQEVIRELCEYSREVRALPELLVSPQDSLATRIRRAFYHLRLSWS